MKTKVEIAQLADKIATRIMTVHYPDGDIVCTRMQSMLKQGDGTEKNLGGRNRSSISAVIYDCLTEEIGEL